MRARSAGCSRSKSCRPASGLLVGRPHIIVTAVLRFWLISRQSSCRPEHEPGEVVVQAAEKKLITAGLLAPKPESGRRRCVPATAAPACCVAADLLCAHCHRHPRRLGHGSGNKQH